MKRSLAAVLSILVIFSMSFASFAALSKNVTYKAVRSFVNESKEITGETVSSKEKDENAIHVKKNTITIKDSQITRKNSSDEASDFALEYGIGAAALVTGGSLLICDSEITTDAKGAAGIFSYDDGLIYAADTSINTQEELSAGINANSGGNVFGWDLDIDTKGKSSPALAIGKSGEKLVIDGGSYTTEGENSPVVSSAADISVNNANLKATESEAVSIEGASSVSLYDCTLSGKMPEGEEDWTIGITDGESSNQGYGCFQMARGSLRSENGGIFYVSDISTHITLKEVDITHTVDSEFFLKCTGNESSNCIFTAASQNIDGDIYWNSVSGADIYLKDKSNFSGAVVKDEGTEGSAKADLYISEDSTWTVTGNSTLSTLNCLGKISDESGASVTIQNSKGEVLVEGESMFIITVDKYEEAADLSGAKGISKWETCQVEKPSAIVKKVDAKEIGLDVLHIFGSEEEETGLVIESENGLSYDGFEVKRSFMPFVYFHTEEIDSSKYQDAEMKKGKTRWYKVRGYVNKDGEKVYSNWSSASKIRF